jgi:4-carboxymuconolactone decarboxylase
LPRPIREIAILASGAHFHSAYEIYAHVLVAELRGITDDNIAACPAVARSPSETVDNEISASQLH